MKNSGENRSFFNYKPPCRRDNGSLLCAGRYNAFGLPILNLNPGTAGNSSAMPIIFMYHCFDSFLEISFIFPRQPASSLRRWAI